MRASSTEAMETEEAIDGVLAVAARPKSVLVPVIFEKEDEPPQQTARGVCVCVCVCVRAAAWRQF